MKIEENSPEWVRRLTENTPPPSGNDWEAMKGGIFEKIEAKKAVPPEKTTTRRPESLRWIAVLLLLPVCIGYITYSMTGFGKLIIQNSEMEGAIAGHHTGDESLNLSPQPSVEMKEWLNASAGLPPITSENMPKFRTHDQFAEDAELTYNELNDLPSVSPSVVQTELSAVSSFRDNFEKASIHDFQSKNKVGSPVQSQQIRAFGSNGADSKIAERSSVVVPSSLSPLALSPVASLLPSSEWQVDLLTPESSLPSGPPDFTLVAYTGMVAEDNFAVGQQALGGVIVGVHGFYRLHERLELGAGISLERVYHRFDLSAVVRTYDTTLVDAPLYIDPVTSEVTLGPVTTRAQDIYTVRHYNKRDRVALSFLARYRLNSGQFSVAVLGGPRFGLETHARGREETGEGEVTNLRSHSGLQLTVVGGVEIDFPLGRWRLRAGLGGRQSINTNRRAATATLGAVRAF